MILFIAVLTPRLLFAGLFQKEDYRKADFKGILVVFLLKYISGTYCSPLSPHLSSVFDPYQTGPQQNPQNHKTSTRTPEWKILDRTGNL